MNEEIGNYKYRLIRHRDIHAVKNTWNTLYSHNSQLTPYQGYSYCAIIRKFSAILIRHRVNNVIYEVRNKDDQPIMLIPLHIERRGKQSIAYLWGHFSQSGHLDIIYTDQIQNDAFLFAIKFIIKDLGNVRFVFNDISERSKLNDLIQSSFKPSNYNVTKRTCVQIPLSNNSKDYLSSLGKNVRQNLRTSFNRLRNENRTYKIATFVNQSIPSNTLKQLFKVYYSRHSDKGLRIGPKKYLPVCIRMRLNPTILALKELINVYYSIIYIDNAVAGFCAGFTSDNEKVIIPFLAINSAFSRYSPGGILITETIKFLIEHHNYKYFDLSRGDEKYKYAYGGIDHFSYSYNIHLEGLSEKR